MREYVHDMKDAWDIVRLEVDHEIAVYVLKLADGKLVGFRPFRDPEAALEAVGLQP